MNRVGTADRPMAEGIDYSWGWRVAVRRMLGILGVGVALMLAVQAVGWFGCFTMVSGPSMNPTLASGELIWVDRRSYGATAPVRGDVVVARHRGEWIVKRVVGLPGEEVEVREGRLYVNGGNPGMQHAVMPGPLSIAPGRLGRDRYALLGDNRSELASTLVHAVVPSARIMGKVLFRVRLWPVGFGVVGTG